MPALPGLAYPELLCPCPPGAPAASATWAFADATGCYWRQRPGAATAPGPGPEVDPAEGHLTITVAGIRITALTLQYSDAWRARYLRSVAAPIVAAQARATAAAARQHPAAATVASAETAHAAVPGGPPPPDTQGRTTPSVAPWLAALGAALGGVGLLALLPRPREAP